MKNDRKGLLSATPLYHLSESINLLLSVIQCVLLNHSVLSQTLSSLLFSTQTRSGLKHRVSIVDARYFTFYSVHFAA